MKRNLSKTSSERKSAVYRPRPTKRRTRAEIDRIKTEIIEVLQAERPATVRQVFYQLVSRGAIGKSEAEYKATVVRLLAEMRLEGTVPWSWIADNSRWQRVPTTYDGPLQLLEDAAQTYRRDLWRSQPVYVEIWLEKDALSGVLLPITSAFGVPLMVSKGYPSLTFLREAAEAIANRHPKPCRIFQFGDHDPSGVDIPRQIERRLREFAPHVDLSFERVAVTPEQIEEWSLPTRPTKRTDTRSHNFSGESVDVDAIPASKLRQLCEATIVHQIDADQWEMARAVEEAERESFTKVIEQFPNLQDDPPAEAPPPDQIQPSLVGAFDLFMEIFGGHVKDDETSAAERTQRKQSRK